MRAFLILALALCLPGCNNDTFPKVQTLASLRVLSLRLDPPEVAPGGTVTLTPLLSDLGGAGRALTYTVETCSDPGVDSDAVPTCDGQPDRATLVSNATVTGLTAPNYTGTAPPTGVSVPATVLNNRSPADQYNGVTYLILYRVTAADGATVTGLKRIYVSNKTPKNTNPTLTAIQANGAALSALPAGVVSLSAVIAAGSAEAYTFTFAVGSTEARTENLVTSWYASDGDLDHAETGAGNGDNWTPPATAPSGRSVVLVGVTRDQRGGESAVVVTIP